MESVLWLFEIIVRCVDSFWLQIISHWSVDNQKVKASTRCATSHCDSLKGGEINGRVFWCGMVVDWISTDNCAGGCGSLFDLWSTVCDNRGICLDRWEIWVAFQISTVWGETDNNCFAPFVLCVFWSVSLQIWIQVLSTRLKMVDQECWRIES